jgi:hypothetical protein
MNDYETARSEVTARRCDRSAVSHSRVQDRLNKFHGAPPELAGMEREAAESRRFGARSPEPAVRPLDTATAPSKTRAAIARRFSSHRVSEWPYRLYGQTFGTVRGGNILSVPRTS